MKKVLSFLLTLFCSVEGLSQSSTLIEPTGTNGIFSKATVGLTGLANNISNPPTAPVSGSGTRLMWIPSRSAFRVGTIVGAIDEYPATINYWNAENIGLFSFASGYNTLANGNYSTAIGTNVIASGICSFAAGVGSKATGYASTAFGSSFATFTYSTSFGNFTEASNNSSTAMGYFTISRGIASTAMGSNTEAFGANSTSMGTYTNSNYIDGLVIGIKNNGDVPLSETRQPDDRLFQIGNGVNDNRSNAMTVLRNGNVGIGNTTETLAPNARLVVDGFTRLGNTAPAIKMLEVTGVTANGQGGSSTATHGLNASKILKLEIYVEVSGQFIPPHYKHNPTLEYDYYFDATNIYILNSASNSSGLLSKPLKILITYKE